MTLLARIDTAIEARDTTQTAVSKKAGSPWLISNWRHKGQSPSVVSLERVAKALNVSPQWLIGKEPEPVAPPNGFHAVPETPDQPDTMLGVAYSAWKADDGRLEPRFFDALEMVGLADSFYLIKDDGSDLRYEHIGRLYIKTLGLDWWKKAAGKRIIDDPDGAFSAWCLHAYQQAIHTGTPSRDRCRVVSRYTGDNIGWKYSRLLLPVEGGLVIVTETIS